MKRAILFLKFALWGAVAGLALSVGINQGYQLGIFPEFLVWLGTIISIPAAVLHVNPYVMNAVLGAALFILAAGIRSLVIQKNP